MKIYARPLRTLFSTPSKTTAPPSVRSFLRTLLIAAAGAVLLGAAGGAPVGPVVRVKGDRFNIETASGAKPVFFRGINLGAAPPGHFPGEFAITKEDYRRWIRFARELHANAIRVYALHPPTFYQALSEENAAHPESPVWLFQEVWTELPDSNDFFDPAFDAGFQGEIRTAIDAIHGKLVLPPRPGHASGTYDIDASPWLAGWILGREWEPYAVRETQRRHPGDTKFRGAYFAVDSGTAMEIWLAKTCERAAAYEANRYGLAHALSFVNWPTLDPMRHPTETEPGGGEMEHDEDAYSVDPSRIRPVREPGVRSGFLGYFATYHVYPYYPDFMNLDPGYASFRDRHGACSYAGYLADLRAHTKGLPLVLGEFGVPSSRGIAHQQPQGINHGGFSEDEQGDRDVRLVEDIADAGCSGALLFALYDEWFKVNWLVRKIDVPPDRDPFWHNLLDPEENYGLISFDPPSKIRIDGNVNDWTGIAPYAKATDEGGKPSPLRALYVASDQERFYLRIDYAPDAGSIAPPRDGEHKSGGTAPPIPSGVRALGVSLDILDPKRGDTRLPAPIQATWSRGAEYVLLVEPPLAGDAGAGVFQGGAQAGRAALFIDRAMNYSLYSKFLSGKTFEWNTAPFHPVTNRDGLYTPLLIETNRERVGHEGTRYPAQHLNWGRLERGTEPPVAALAGWSDGDSGRAYDPHAEWQADPVQGVIEVAIPWGLLNVGDPSTHAVVDDKGGSRETETTRTSGIGLLAWATTAPGFVADSTGPSLPKAAPAPLAQCAFLGPLGTKQLAVNKGLKLTQIVAPDSAVYLWNGWNAPITKEHVKRSAGRVRQAYEGMEARESSSRTDRDGGKR
ncbi:MAG: hypothetical protein ACRENN_03695 [Candidatus Eiseniibacteriota bacterium]